MIKGHVGSDGMGDVYHIKRAAKSIHDKYPNWEVKTVLQVECLLENKRMSKLPMNDPSYFIYGIRKESEALEDAYSNPYAYYLPEELPFLDQRRAYKNAVEAVKRAELVIDMPHSDGTCNIPGETLSFVEHSPRFQPFPNRIPMGPGPFEFGFFLSELKGMPHPVSDLETLSLKKFLTSCFTADEEMNKTMQLYFAYCHTMALSFLLTCCVTVFSSGAKQAIVLFPIPYDLSTRLKRCHDLPEIDFLKKWGVKELLFFEEDPIRGYQVVDTIEIQKEGIIIQVINPFPLSNHDIQILMENAMTTGCTGDVSLLQSIEAKCLSDYEITKHKTEFF